MRVPLLEHLHHDARMATIPKQRRACMVEIRIGVVALAHLLDGQIEHFGRKPLVRPFLKSHELVPLPVMLPSFWVASSKPEAAFDRSKASQPC
jgi:hypothetical protein